VEEHAELGELIEVRESFDDSDTPAEEELVNADDLGEVVHISDGGRLDAENFDVMGDAPRGEFVGDAREAVAVERGVGSVPIPIGAEEEALAVDELGGDGAEVRNGEEGAGRDGCEIDD
jgi:hypothetical protein